MISFLLYYFSPRGFPPHTHKGKDSLKGSNLIHKTIPQEAGGLERKLPTPFCKDSARQIAAAPGYQKADVYMLLVSGSGWKWWPHGRAGIRVSLGSFHLDGAGMSSFGNPQANESAQGSSWQESRFCLCLGENKDLGSWPGVSPPLCMYACSVMSDSMWPHGFSPSGSSVHGIFQARILTGMGCHFLPQGIFLTQELNPRLLH